MRGTVAFRRYLPIGRIRLVAPDVDLARLRIHGDGNSLLAALVAQCTEQQRQTLQPLRPVVRPIRRQPTPELQPGGWGIRLSPTARTERP